MRATDLKKGQFFMFVDEDGCRDTSEGLCFVIDRKDTYLDPECHMSWRPIYVVLRNDERLDEIGAFYTVLENEQVEVIEIP